MLLSRYLRTGFRDRQIIRYNEVIDAPVTGHLVLTGAVPLEPSVELDAPEKGRPGSYV